MNLFGLTPKEDAEKAGRWPLSSLEGFAWQAQLHEYEHSLSSTPEGVLHPMPPIPVKGRVRSLQEIERIQSHLSKEWEGPTRHPGRALWKLQREPGIADMLNYFRSHVLDGDIFWAGLPGDERDKWLLVCMNTDEFGRVGYVLPSSSNMAPLDDTGSHIVPKDYKGEGYVWKRNFPYTMYDTAEDVGFQHPGETLAQTFYRMARRWQDGKHDLF